ncbi:MAG: acyltransferase family protein [Janthinobacterium lividum]
MTRMHYRADIDGLRAVAVLLVVLGHLRTRVTGGYVGVDVFFVLSGYLIGAHILSEIQADRFSLADFYERRVRRIFPALLVMLAASSAAAWFVLLPTELKDFSQAQLAALSSIANFTFLRQAGYFDTASLLNPLLHTWSLAVEEQFYLSLPLLVLLAQRRCPGRVKQLLWLLTAASLLAAAVWVYRAPSVAFYSSPLRAWELLVGTVLSQRWLLPRFSTRTAREVGAALGLLLILIPALLYSDRTAFPGLAALPVCLGTALIVAAGEEGSSTVGSLLLWQPAVFVGAISYSLYLWHWPLIVFWNRASLQPDAELTRTSKMGLLAASLLMAVLSYYLVESPFRKGRWKPVRSRLFALAGGAAACLLAFSIVALVGGGVPGRFPPNAVKLAAYAGYQPDRVYRQSLCFLVPKDSFSSFSVGNCLQAKGSGPRFLLLGDSMAAHLYPGLRSNFPNWQLLQANAADCRPFVTQPASLQSEFAANCVRMSAMIFGEYLPAHPVDSVLLAASWQSNDLEELGQTLAWLRARHMHAIVFGPVPEYDTPLPRVLAFALRNHDPLLPARHLSGRTRELDHRMSMRAADTWHVPYISTYDLLCPAKDGSRCTTLAAPDVPLQFDTHHFTEAGSSLFARVLRQKGLLPEAF